MSVSRSTFAVRTSALIALGALAVHQLRYLAGGDATSQGHSYLGVLLPLLIVLAASSVVGATVAAVSTGSRTGRSASWASCAVALMVIFGAQETAEGLAPFAHGGWIAVPLAIAVGRVISLCLALFRSVERRLVAVRARRVARAPAVVGRARLGCAPPLAGEPLAFGLARRPPPLRVA